MRQIVVLFIIIHCAYGLKVAIFLDLHIPPASLKSELKQIYDRTLIHRNDVELCAYGVAHEVQRILPWVLATQHSIIHKAIDNLVIEQGQCTNWIATLEQANILSQQVHVDEILLIMFSPPNCDDFEFSKLHKIAQRLHSEGTIVRLIDGMFEHNFNFQKIVGPCGLIDCGPEYWIHIMSRNTIHKRAVHFTIQGNVEKNVKGTIDAFPGVVLQLKDACDGIYTTTTNGDGNYVLNGCAISGNIWLTLFVPASYTLLSGPPNPLSLFLNESTILDTFVLSQTSIGEGPLSAGEIVAVVIVGILLAGSILSCLIHLPW